MHVRIDGAGVWSDGGQDKRHVTDEAGRFALERVPTGKVIVRTWPRMYGEGPYDGSAMPAVITASGDSVELSPIRLGKRRLARGEVAGDFGYRFKEAEPGADPMLTRLVVATVRPGSPAAAAGLAPGDEIVTIDGQNVTGPDAYLFVNLTSVPAGTTVRFGLASGASLALTAAAPP
jgi:membrane-associated protease RseP (regulator of RpoE activity)